MGVVERHMMIALRHLDEIDTRRAQSDLRKHTLVDAFTVLAFDEQRRNRNMMPARHRVEALENQVHPAVELSYFDEAARSVSGRGQFAHGADCCFQLCAFGHTYR